MNLQFNIQLTNGQQEAYDMAHSGLYNKLLMVFSRQSGKSVLAEILLIEYLCKKYTYNAYISPTFSLGRKVFKEIVQLLEGTGIIKKANATTLTIETIFSSYLQFFSAEAYTAIRGFTISGVLIIDEAAYIQDVLPNGEQFWGNVIMPITKAKKPLVLMISTPCGKQGFFYDFYLRALNKEDGIGLVKRTIYDDSLVSEDEIAEIKKNIPAKAFAQEFECEFLDSALTFFEGFEHCFKDFVYSGDVEWIGVDLSGMGSDDTIVSKVNSRNEVEIHKVTGSLDMKYQKIADIINNSNSMMCYMENNGLGAPIINEVKKLVRHKRIEEWTTTNASKEEIISYMAVQIANKDVVFNVRDTELYSQLGTFISKISKSKKMTFGALDGHHDDMIMATAIALKAKKDYAVKFNRSLGAVLKM